MQSWLLLAYKVPRHPTSNRVYVWRKLRHLGALLLSDALWILPATAKTHEHLQWLGAEIEELGGEYTLWDSRPMSNGQQQALVKRFSEQVDTQYRKVLAQLTRSKADLTALSKQYQQTHAQDFFGSKLGKQTLGALMKAKGESKP